MYVKDRATGIVHNLNESELRTTMALREKAKKEKAYVAELNSLKSEIQEIRGMLADIYNKRLLNDSASI